MQKTSTPLDFQAVVRKQYEVLPVSRDLISSNPNQCDKIHVLWVGCSDSSVLETETLDVPREEMFVHRNLGNVLSGGDLSSRSAVEWCVDLLKVDHIIVCGHYECALMEEGQGDAMKDCHKDMTNIHALHDAFLAEKKQGKLDKISLDHKFEEVYVLAEADWLRREPHIQEAMQTRNLKIHAFVYDREKNACVQLIEKDQAQLASIKI